MPFAGVAEKDRHPSRNHEVEVVDLHFYDRRAEFLELSDRPLDGGANVWRDGVVEVVRALDADANAGQIRIELGRVVVDWLVDRASVGPVEPPGHHAEHQGCVPGGARQAATVSSVGLIGNTPVRLTRPNVGLIPTTPLTAAGTRIDPPVSVPTAP